jgi:23S rRNA (pseudouridine1915-N3)-methyltransferase
MKLRLILLGKTRQRELRALQEDYLHRIRRYTEIERLELRDARAAARMAPPAAAAHWVLLAAEGRQFTSAEFAGWLAELRDRGTRELVFLCGAAEGVPESFRRLAHSQLSLSPLTLPHELARVVLLEQLYRAFALLAGHPYPR